MDYKKIIKGRNVRVKLLKMLSWIPDKMMIKLQYRIKFNRRLNLKDPKRFTEKLQWYKLYYHDPQMTKCAGKLDVREYVEGKGLGHILNELYGVYDCADEIDFAKLPDRYVLKATVGAAGQQVFVCTDSSTVDEAKVRQQVGNWIKTKQAKKNAGREWAYNGITQKLIAEKYIDSSECENGLLSYKFFCFHGKVKFLYVIADIKDGFFDAGYGIYGPDFERLPYNRTGDESVLLEMKQGKPENFEQMVAIAEKLSEDFPHVRVDLYNVKGEIIFGELTFYNDSGYMRYDPDTFDYMAGEMFELPQKRI